MYGRSLASRRSTISVFKKYISFKQTCYHTYVPGHCKIINGIRTHSRIHRQIENRSLYLSHSSELTLNLELNVVVMDDNISEFGASKRNETVS